MDRRLTRGALVAAFAVAASVPQGRAEAAGVDAVVEGGDVFVRPADGDETAISTRAHVSTGSTLRVGDRPATMTVAPGLVLRLEAGTTAILGGLSWLPAEHPGAKQERAVQITLTTGAADVEARDGTLGATLLLPGGTNFALWRGVGHVAAMGDHAAAALYEGTAIAGANEKWKQLLGGNGAVLTKTDAPLVRPLPAAPAWVDGAPPFAIVRDDAPAPIALKWAPTEDAGAYEVEIGHDPQGKDARRAAEGPATTFDTKLAPGTYVARVRARSRDGIPGPASPLRPLRIVRAILPTSAVVASDSAIVLTPSSAITLDDPRGLDVAYVSPDAKEGAPAHWLPAPASIALGTFSTRVVRLRHTPTGGEGRLVLAKRDLRARVEVGPKRARWPEDAVDVVVDLEDPTHRIDPAREVVAFDVRVNVAPVAVDWTHDGARWRARVPAQIPPGPWVVRVTARDSSGTSIGAGFLEVDGPRIEGTTHRVADVTEVRIVH